MDWKRIIQLVQQTGERCVVFDAESDEPLVVMPLSEFEALAANMLGEDEYECEDDDCGHNTLQPESLPADLPFEPETGHWFPETDESMSWNEHVDGDETIEEEPWYIEPIVDNE